MKSDQHFKIELEKIIPGYYDSNKYVKRIFLKRWSISLEHLYKIKAMRIMDAGCGDGLFTNMMKNLANFDEVIGVDLNVNTSRLNNKYKGIKFIMADLLKMKFKKKFDAITCLDVLEHFEDPVNVINNIKKSIRTSGHLIVSAPIEGFGYRLGRLVTQGRYHQKPDCYGSGRHCMDMANIDSVIRREGFRRVAHTRIRFLLIPLFDVNLYQKKGDT